MCTLQEVNYSNIYSSSTNIFIVIIATAPKYQTMISDTLNEALDQRYHAVPRMYITHTTHMTIVEVESGINHYPKPLLNLLQPEIIMSKTARGLKKAP